MGSNNLPVYCMKRMQNFIKNNAPWNQLVKHKNINLKLLQNITTVNLNERINITPRLVPHREELSETIGFNITVNNKKLLFIPDINNWSQWEKDITKIITDIDYAFLDATFYKKGEIDRNMNEIPHPFVEESLMLFNKLKETERKKIYFIHFNHTNPLLINGSKAQKEVLKQGYNIAEEGSAIQF